MGLEEIVNNKNDIREIKASSAIVHPLASHTHGKTVAA